MEKIIQKKSLGKIFPKLLKQNTLKAGLRQVATLKKGNKNPVMENFPQREETEETHEETD